MTYAALGASTVSTPKQYSGWDVGPAPLEITVRHCLTYNLTMTVSLLSSQRTRLLFHFFVPMHWPAMQYSVEGKGWWWSVLPCLQRKCLRKCSALHYYMCMMLSGFLKIDTLYKINKMPFYSKFVRIFILNRW